ncbi:holo-ACP synthase [Prosthecochloris sp. HL-130-GSB]|jgi:holo-[acyl-carrier protein] synthase|uniref:Holo-[acyl-carrier-protein] synthase n=1 Tax=Prosthecochloris aestuarii TaxID=1102 RepID=A0A831SS79_PROAE|nr:holo-ACP synthase [Prosthecochloris sp. HL-130-GSB]ARM30158.1 holo-[acyl-carrier-protein] synthase [Prosthecochloris sp. HL-130-GSB]HED30223.1 holo-[acyl-carrier-protein] synthase [Prosthecochloris aestuarii]
MKPDTFGNREVGVDIVDISRIRRSWEQYGDQFLRRVLTESEMEECRKKGNMMASVAARFAAKEAVSKAIGTGLSKGFSWHSIEIGNDETGRPLVRVVDTSLGIDGSCLKLSLSHDGPFAIAFVLLDCSGIS